MTRSQVYAAAGAQKGRCSVWREHRFRQSPAASAARMLPCAKNRQTRCRFTAAARASPSALKRRVLPCCAACSAWQPAIRACPSALLQQLGRFLNQGITPVVPCEGSVGASGDLTPMSYVAACLAGERDVFYTGRRMSARQALKKAGLNPYVFEPKEPLAMVNGTSTMTGIAVMAVERSPFYTCMPPCAPQP